MSRKMHSSSAPWRSSRGRLGEDMPLEGRALAGMAEGGREGEGEGGRERGREGGRKEGKEGGKESMRPYIIWWNDKNRELRVMNVKYSPMDALFKDTQS